MSYSHRPYRLSSMLMAVGMMLVPLAAVVMTQASSLNAPGGLLFLNTPEVEIIPKGAMISRLSLGLDRKGSTALIVNTGIRPFTGVAHMTRSVNAVIGNATMPLFTQEDVFTSNGKEAVIHETVYSDDEKIYERRMARLSQNHAAAGTQPVFYGPAAGGTAVASDLSVVPAKEDTGVTARRNARLAQLQSVAAAHGTAMPAIRSDASSAPASAGLFSRSLQIVLMALGPATDGQVLGYQNGRLVWIDIDQAYSSLHPVSSGRIPYVQPADGSPVERHYGGGGSQPSASTATSGGSQRDFGGQPINLGSEVTGVLSVGRGGTGLGSIGSGSLLVGNAAGTFMDFGIGTNGQVLTVTPTGGLMWSSVSVTGLSQLYADTHYVKQTGDTMTGGLTINLKSGSLGLNIVQTASGAYLHAEKGLSSSGALAVAGTALLKNDTTVRGTLSGAALRIMGSAGFSGTTVFTKDVRFNSTLTINGQTYSFAGSQTPNGYLKTDGAGNLTWATVSGGAGTFSSGNVLTLGDARYIRKAGGTMTGSLTIDLTSGFLGLNVRQTLSGAYLFAQKGLSTSGSLIAGGNVAARGSLSGANLTVQSGDSYILGRLGVGKISPQTKLDVVGTISGSALKISGLISGSGGILVQGNATFRGTLSGSLLTVSSLKNCAVLVTNANGSLSCGTAAPSFSSGNVVTIGDSRYLRTAGGTMTGNLTVRAAISGSSLNISGNITSSGTLVSRGSITTRGSLSGALLTLSGLRNCDTIDTDSNGNLVCGTDNTASAGLDMGTADNRYIRKAGGTMTGSLTIDLTSGFLGLNVRQTLSGAYLFAQKGLSTSGSLIAGGNVAARGTLSGGLLTIMNGNSYIQNGSLSIGKTSVSAGTKLDVVGTISGSALKISGLISGSGGMILKGALMFQNFGNCTLKTDGNGNVTCGTDLTGGGAGTFGSGNVVTIGDSRYLRTAGGTMTGNLTVRAAMSGSSLNISGNITNSGSIVTKNSIITKSIFSGAGLLLNGNAMIRGTMSGRSLTVTGTGSRPLLTTDTTTNTLLIGSGSTSLAVTSTGAMTPNLYTGISYPSGYIGSGATSITPYVMKLQGRLAYIANFNQSSGLQPKLEIYDISVPQSPVRLSSTAFGSANQAISSLIVSGHYAYLSNFQNNQIYVFDVSSPTVPFLIANIAGAADEVQGRYLFGVVPSSGTLTAYDISNPSGIVAVGTAGFSNSTQTSYMAAQGRYLYVSNGTCCTAAFSVFDISNPSNMVKVGTISSSISANVSALVAQGRYVYLASGVSSTVQIIDVSTPSSPTLVKTLAVGSGNNGRRRLSLQGRYLYVTDLSGVVSVVDISNPRVAKTVGTIPYVGTINDVSVQGRYLYALNGSKNAINTFDIGGTYIQQLEVGGIETSQLVVRGNAAVFGELNVAGGASFGRGIYVQGQSAIVNTSTGSNAFTVISAYSGALRIAARGTTNTAHIMFGTGTTYDVQLRRPTGNALQTNANLYAASLSGTQLLIRGSMSGSSLNISGNITNSGSIVTKGGITTKGSFSGKSLTISGTGGSPLMATDIRYGTIIMGTGAMRNGTGAMAPQLYVTSRMPARFAGSGATQANPAAIAVQGRYAYVVNYTANSFQIFDVSTRQPQLVSTTTSGINGPYGVLVQGRYAYVQNYTGTSNVRIYDVSNPSSPVAMGSVIAGGTQANFAIQGRYLYSQTFNSGVFRVTDISNPSAPFVVGSLTFGNYGGGVTVSGRYAYVSNSFGTAATYVVDVSNPATPFTAATISTAFRYSQLKVVGKYLYLGATGGLGMKIYDISNPLSAVLVSTISGNAASFDVSGRYVYIANGSNSLQAYDISNPRVPVFVGATAFGALLQGISVQGRYAYTIDYTNSSINVTDLGGAYIQQLEAGGIEVGTLAVRGNASVYGSLDVIGAGAFGRGIHAQGPSMFNNSSTGAYTLSITSKSGAMLALGSGGAVVPTAALYIETKDSDNIEGIRIRSRETSATQDMFKIITDVSSTNNTVFRISGSGAVYADGVYNSAGADYAEWFASKDPDLMPGEVVCIDPLDDNTVKRCTRDADTNLMGIISTHPAYIGNRITGADGVMPPGYKLVGLIGQVPAKVTLENGPVHPGDSLTSASKPGFARRANVGESTVGVALEAFNGTSGPEAVINVLISRRNQSLTVEGVEQKVLDSIAAMKIEDQVNQMVGDTIRNFNLDDSVTAVVHDQLAALDVAAQVRQLIDQRLSSSGVTLSADGIANVMQKRYGLSANSGATVVTADMFLSGALKATSVTLANLRVEADAAILGTLHAAAIDASGSIVSRSLSVSAGATIQGGLRIDGPVATGSGFSLGSLTLSGSEVNIGSLLDHNSLKVIGGVTINGLAVFFGDVELKGELKLSSKQVGYAVIPQTGTSVTVLFSSGFTAKPIVTASPDYPVLYAVSKATATGFTIRIASPAPETVTFSWIAIPTDAPRTSSGTTMTGSFIAFPVDHAGVPVSTNAIWNACVRNQTILDTDGQPFSCSRYHTDAQWDHPDLHITFTWNGTSDPKILLLPVGYQAVVQEQGNALAVSSDSSSEQSDNSFVSEESSSGSSESNSESSVTSSSSSSEESSSSSESSTSSSESSTSSSDSSSSSSEPNS